MQSCEGWFAVSAPECGIVQFYFSSAVDSSGSMDTGGIYETGITALPLFASVCQRSFRLLLQIGSVAVTFDLFLHSQNDTNMHIDIYALQWQHKKSTLYTIYPKHKTCFSAQQKKQS